MVAGERLVFGGQRGAALVTELLRMQLDRQAQAPGCVKTLWASSSR